MKTLLLGTLLIISNVTFGQFETLPDSNATWQVTHIDFGFVSRYQYFVPRLNYDTTINNTPYSKIYKANCDWTSGTYYGAYRSLPSGETFFIPDGTMEEHYLYKHNVQIGDTVVVWKAQGGYDGPFTIDSVTVENISNPGPTQSVHVDFIGGLNDTWEAGRGTRFYGPWTSDIQYFGVVEFNCFSVYDTTGTQLGVDDLCQRCDFDLSVEELFGSNIQVYPNPFQSSIELTHLPNEAQLELYQLDGRFVCSVSADVHAKVNLPNLKNGDYLLKIRTNEGSVTRKISKY